MNKFLKYIFLSTIIFLISCSDNKNENGGLSFQKEQSKVQSFRGFYFISEFQGEFRLMYYDFLEDSILTIFSDKKNNVLEVEHNIFNNTVFFLTLQRLNKKTAIPEFEGIRLYRYDDSKNKTELLNRFEPSIQIYSFWMDINRYKLVRVYFDEIVASYVNKHTLIYNPFGKLLSEEIAVFDLVTSGYPVNESVSPKFFLPDKKFQIKFDADSVFVFNIDSNKSKKILTGVEIIDLIWADNNKHLIIFYEESESKVKSILLFDLTNNKNVRTFDRKGIKNFQVIGNYLIFDFIENGLQRIEVFNFERLLTVKQLDYGKNNFLKNATFR